MHAAHTLVLLCIGRMVFLTIANKSIKWGRGEKGGKGKVDFIVGEIVTL